MAALSCPAPTRTGPSRRSTPTTALILTVLLAATIATVATPAPAEAQAPTPAARAEARRLLREGNRAFAQSNFTAALEKFERALQVVPSARIHYNIGQTLRELRRPVDAVEAFEKFLKESHRVTPVERRETATALRELETQVARITVVTNVTDVAVTIDGRLRGNTPLRTHVVLAPGSHEIVLGRAGYLPFQEKFSVTGGEKRRATFNLRELPAAPPPPVARVIPAPVAPAPVPTAPPVTMAPPPATTTTTAPAPPSSIYEAPVTTTTPLPYEAQTRQGWSTSTVVGVTLLIASAAMAAGGGVLMGSAWSRFNDAEKSCDVGLDCETAADEVDSRVLWSKLLFGGAGLAGVAGAGVFLFSAGDSDRPGDVGARSLFLVKQGRF